MDEKIIATFCLCDDLLKATGHHDSSLPQQLIAFFVCMSGLSIVTLRHESLLN